MHIRSVRYIGLLVSLCALGAQTAWALNEAVPFIHGDGSATGSRTLFGNGTGAIIGIVDSGIDDTHPALTGNDSLGNPRMVAEHNYVTGEGGNTGDDVFGHGTWVASAALSRHATFTGMATDARYVNARVLNSNNQFANANEVLNGIGFAIDQGADVLNLSLNFASPVSNGNQKMDLMLDWAAYSRGISCAICAGNISTGDGSTTVRSPASAYNGLAVGRSGVQIPGSSPPAANYSRMSTDSATATTADGRMKPDVVAPGTLMTLASDDWEGTAPDFESRTEPPPNGVPLNGCSFATPLVSGLIAQQLEAGATHSLSTDPLVVKATVMNSADRTITKPVVVGGNTQFVPLAPLAASNVGGVYTATAPLDNRAGAGQVDGQSLAEQYLAGEFAPGLVAPVGWDLHSIGGGQSIDYAIQPYLLAGELLSTTLTWYRHVTRTDGGIMGAVDSGDSFVAQALTNLNLQILRNGTLVAESISAVDNVEQLNLLLDATSRYTLRVLNLGGAAEQFALAWHGIAAPVPEPTSVALGALALAGLLWRRRR